jgi:hypothetical protein
VCRSWALIAAAPRPAAPHPPPPPQALLDQLHHSSPAFRAGPTAVLDAPDEEGATALILAARGGHAECLRLLLARGAALEAQSRRSDSGSALHEAAARRHAAALDVLLEAGASPFVENGRGYTAMDLGCSTKAAELLRRMEAGALWRGWVLQKVPRLGGLSTEWQRRWAVVCHRLPRPGAPPERRLAHVVLLCYKGTDAFAPACRAWLDGARAAEAPAPRGGRPRGAVALHRKHAAPAGASAAGGPREGGFQLAFRPDDESPPGVAAFRAFLAAADSATRAAAAGGGGGGAPARVAPPPSAGAARPPRASSPRFSPLGAGAAAATASDAALAARLQQEEDDALLAARLARRGDAGGGGAHLAPAPSGPPMSQPSSDVGAFYPTIRFADDRAAAAAAAASHSPLGAASSLAASAWPSAPPAPGATPPPASTTEEDDLCVVCQDAPARVGLVHGSSAHKCCCRACAAELCGPRGSGKCPLCNQRITSVLDVF